MTQTKLPKTFLARMLSCGLILNLVSAASAAISVTGSGAGPFTFDTLPTVAEGWSTLTVGGSAATIGSAAAQDAAVQTLSAASITTALGSSGTVPPSTANIARWNSAAFYVQTRPTGNDYLVLMATLQNDTGGDVGTVTVNYNYTVPTAPAEQINGLRAFYSVSGAPGSWTLIPEFSSIATAGALTATFNVVWPASTPMYLAWADDNADGGTEGSFTIDDFAVSTTGLTVTPITITNQPQSIAVAERAPVSFTVGAEGTPQAFHWLSNSTPIPGANSATYTIASAHYSANGAVFSCVVSNLLGGVSSSDATLTVNPDTTAPTAVSGTASGNNLQVQIVFSEPMRSSDASAFRFFQTGTDPNVTEFFGTTANVVGNTFTIDLGTPLADGVNYSVEIYDQYDTSDGVPGGNIIDPSPSVIPIRRDLLLIDFDGPNNLWKYSTETNLFGTGWETVAYDDSLWPQDQQGFGRDASVNGVAIRTATYPINDSAPQFFRRHFFLPAATNGVTLTFRHVFEDGAVIYINGQEARRVNVNAGALTVASRAAGTATDPTPISGVLTLPLTNVVAGDNVIAVVVLQSGATSTDMEMALELTANIGEFAAGPPVINVPPQSQTVAEGAAASFSVSASGALPLTYQWRKGGNPILGATFPTYSIANVLPTDAGSYDVLVSNSISFATSAAATLTVEADLTAPVFVSAVGSTNLTNITLTIYDAYGLNTAAAQTAGNYSVTGPNSLTIESAVLVNSSNVLLTTSPRTQSQSYTVTLSGIVDRSAAANVATPSSRPLLGGLVILAPDDSTLWRYDSSSNNLDGLGWELTGYNDSGWLTGLAGFANRPQEIMPAGGFETRTTNLVAVNVGGSPTVYFRVPFNFPGNPATAQLRLVGVVDDGLVAYINGVEAGRIRITNAAPVSFTNFATAASPETGDVHGLNEVLLTTSSLLQGNNLLAIQLHQNNATSSDVAFSIQLVGEIAEFTAVGPTLHIVDNSNGTVTITWTGGGTLQSSTDISNAANWANVVPPASSPYTTSTAGAPKFFRVTVP